MQLRYLNSWGILPLPRLSHQLRPVPAGISIPDNRNPSPKGAIKARKKDNIWSVDNDVAEKKAAKRERKSRMTRRKNQGGGGGKGKGNGKRKLDLDSRILISGSMLMETETVLQTQEPVIMPSWDTFTSSLIGIYKGIGAAFSPFTAKMEAISLNTKRQKLYDCYTLSKISRNSDNSRVLRTTNWAPFNTEGESGDADVASFDSFDMKKFELMEEDLLGLEPGLVFFEDGSYSRGPAEIPVGDYEESNYFLSPTFKFEQCLVKGCHKRLRIVHTIEFSEGGAHLQVMRVAVYEEQWVGPSSIDFPDEGNFKIKPFSQRKRAHSSELTGSWKVFEVTAIPIPPSKPDQITNTPFMHLCTETLKTRTLPERSCFSEEELGDVQDAAVLWLPSGVTGFVDVDEEGVLCIGVGWYSDEGVNLVMERDYGTDGKLREVRWKTEVKRRWNE